MAASLGAAMTAAWSTHGRGKAEAQRQHEAREGTRKGNGVMVALPEKWACPVWAELTSSLWAGVSRHPSCSTPERDHWGKDVRCIQRASISFKWLNPPESQLPNPKMGKVTSFPASWSSLCVLIQWGSECTWQRLSCSQNRSLCQPWTLFSLYLEELGKQVGWEQRGVNSQCLPVTALTSRAPDLYLRINVFKSPFKEKGFHQSVNC